MSVRILVGDCRALLATLPEKSVQTTICSPPYWNLRAYGVGAEHGELGSEDTPEAYVANLVEVFRAVKRVLRDDGLLFVNLGDSYAGGKTGRDDNSAADRARMDRHGHGGGEKLQATGNNGVARKPPPGYKAKNLMLLPARVALALQGFATVPGAALVQMADGLRTARETDDWAAVEIIEGVLRTWAAASCLFDGWILRSVMPWIKASAMPECLDPQTHVFVKDSDGIHRITLDDLYESGQPYPLILTPNGWQHIHQVWETIKDEALTLDVAKVSTVTCSPEHLWPVSHDRRRTVMHNVPAAELRDNGYRDYLLHQSIAPFLDGTTTHYSSRQALDYDLGWLLGLYAAEGGFGERRGYRCKFTMHAKETEYLDRAQQIAERKFGAKCSRRLINNYGTLRFSSEEWYRLAPSIVSGKSTTKALNLDVVLNAPAEFREGLWAGYIVGDGWLRTRGVSATSASRALRDDMAVLASAIGLITSKKTNKQFDSRTGKTYVSYQLWTPYVTHRKQKKGTTTRQLTIRNKRRAPGPHRMIDVEVCGGLFIIDDGLVTHNSVQDRPSSALEYVFMFSQKARYFYDAEAVRQGAEYGRRSAFRSPQYEHNRSRDNGAKEHEYIAIGGADPSAGRAFRNTDLFRISVDDRIDMLEAEVKRLRAQRDAGGLILDEDGDPLALDVNPAGYPGAHFATFPEKLVLPLIRAGSSEKGACPSCGTAWTRVVERGTVQPEPDYRAPNKRLEPGQAGNAWAGNMGFRASKLSGQEMAAWKAEHPDQTTGWCQSCPCPPAEPVRQTVLDPFAGAGTTLLVAERLGRDSIGIELSPTYAQLAEARIRDDAPLLAEVEMTGGAYSAPSAPLVDKQGQLGKRTYSGFNARWDEKKRVAQADTPAEYAPLDLFGEMGA